MRWPSAFLGLCGVLSSRRLPGGACQSVTPERLVKRLNSLSSCSLRHICLPRETGKTHAVPESEAYTNRRNGPQKSSPTMPKACHPARVPEGAVPPHLRSLRSLQAGPLRTPLPLRCAGRPPEPGRDERTAACQSNERTGKGRDFPSLTEYRTALREPLGAGCTAARVRSGWGKQPDRFRPVRAVPHRPDEERQLVEGVIRHTGEAEICRPALFPQFP